MEIELKPLRTFLEVARAESYTEAGRRLHLTQSAVSHAVRGLEERLGRRLVEWHGKRFALTEAGQHLHQACERVFEELGQVGQRFSSEQRGITLRAVIGATVEFGTTVLIRKMKPLLDAHPELHLDFHFSHELVLPLLQGALDLVVDCAHHQHAAIQRTALFREQYAVVAAPGFLRGRTLREPGDLGAVPVLSMDAGADWWQRLLGALLPARRPVLEHVVAINHVRGLINAAHEGLGVALVPRYTVLGELRRGELVELFAELPLHEDHFCLYQRRTAAQRPVNRLLTEYLLGIDASEFGDSIGKADRSLTTRGTPPPRKTGPRVRTLPGTRE